MDKRNYDELYDHTLDNCDCDDDSNCGCTYPNNISNIYNCTPEQNCNSEELEASDKQDSALAKQK